MIHTVPVDVAGRPYDVMIGPGLVKRAGELVRPLLARSRLAVVMDQTVSDLHRAAADRCRSLVAAGIDVHPIVIPPGEEAKSFAGLASRSADARH